MKKTMLLIVALLLAAAMGVAPAFAGGEEASASGGWRCREFMTWIDSERVAHVNEAFVELIVPVNQTFESDALKVTVIDAAYDGRSALVCWTVQNKLDTPIYMLCNPSMNGVYAAEGMGMNESGLMINPGEMINSGRASSLIDNGPLDAETCEVLLPFTALSPAGPLVTLSDEEIIVDGAAEALIAEGKVAVEETGNLWLGNMIDWEKYQDMDYADILVDIGVMKRTDSLEVSFSLAKNATATIGVSDRAEIDFGDYKIRFVEAVKTPNTVVILMDAVFENETAAKRYEINPLAAMQTYGRPAMLYFKDSAGEDYFGMKQLGNYSFGSIEREATPQPDGTWTWRARASAVNFVYADDICKIMTMAPVDADKTEFEEQVITITFGGEEASANGAMDANERAKALNEQLGKLLAKLHPELQFIDPEIGSYIFSADSFTQQEYDDLSARIAEVDQQFFDEKGEMIPMYYGTSDELLTKAWRLVQSLDLSARQPDDAFIAFVDEVFKEAGYTGLANRSYQYRHWVSENSEHFDGWQVTASDGDLKDMFGPNVLLHTAGDDKIISLSSPYPEYVTFLGGYVNPRYPKAPLSPEERQTLRDIATAFYEKYLYHPTEVDDVVLVSDRAHGDKEGYVNPYGGVWIYAPSTPQYFGRRETPPTSAPFDKAEPGSNLGLWFQIDLETGMIYSVESGVEMSLFANGAYAETDWVTLTGEEFPIQDDMYYMNYLARDLIVRYEDLAVAFSGELTDEERLIVRHIVFNGIGDENISYLSPLVDWQKLLSDITACDSLDAFRAVLYGDYAYFNQSPPEAPTRDEILKAAEPTINALGYGDMPLRSFLYTGPISGGGVDCHDIVIAKTLGEGELWPEEAVVAAFDNNGKVRYMNGRSISFYEKTPVTEEEQSKIADRVWDVLMNCMEFPGAPFKGSVHVAKEAGRGSHGSRFIKAYAVLEVGAGQPIQEDSAVTMIIDMDTERIIEISLYLADHVEEYFMNSVL